MENRTFLDRVQGTPDRAPKGAIESEGRPLVPVFFDKLFSVPSREIKISGKPIPEPVLDDLCARFLLNIPECEKDNMIRLMFQGRYTNLLNFSVCKNCKSNAESRISTLVLH